MSTRQFQSRLRQIPWLGPITASLMSQRRRQPDLAARVSIWDTSYPVKVVAIQRHGDRAVTLSLELEEGYRLHVRPGQFVRLAVGIGPAIYQRCYSICAPVQDNRLSLTVQRQFQGRVSNYINDDVRVGDCLYIDDPSGDFVLPENPDGLRYVFIAAGSGIAPVLGVIEELLSRNPQADIQLFYSVRRREQALFLTRLHVLEQRHTGLRIRYTQTRGESGERHHSRRLRADQFLQTVTDPESALYYLCAPAAMTRQFMAALHEAGIDEQRIRAAD